jgi:hypothetical protein
MTKPWKEQPPFIEDADFYGGKTLFLAILKL